jgi:hypothetical protein
MVVQRGRGTLVLKEDVTLKHPSLDEIAFAKRGMELPTLHWVVASGVVTFTLDDKSIVSSKGAERNTWSVVEDAIAFTPAQPEDNGVIKTPKPTSQVLREYPVTWKPDNVGAYLKYPIAPNGNFTWWEATHGGTRMPPDQKTVDAIVRIAKLAQKARDQINLPFNITSWYRPDPYNRQCRGATNSQHKVGAAIDFLVEDWSGERLFKVFDEWWPGGLGLYGGSRKNLCHLDARVDKHGRLTKVRWKH